MKINITYTSKFGNGKKCVEELKGILEKKGQEVEVFSISETKPNKLPEADIYIFSSPVRMFVLPLKMRGFLKRFKPLKSDSKYALMTTYITQEPMAFAKMDKLLEGKGMKKVTTGFCAKVKEIKGPLEEGYRKKLEDFAEELVKI
ncbi:MAG: flavodoxin family protein [Actinobacteria bacterium]|nr:flavodoxin family protein [Actinomycetota bacterium]